MSAAATDLATRADAPATAPSPPRRRRFPWWTCFAVVVVAALVVGSGVFRASPPTAAQRAVAIEADLRCPSCEDLSVAQSDAPTAVAVRAAIRRQISAGRTDDEIESYLVSRYGSSIELAPPASGWSLLVWLLPLVVGVAGLATVVVVLVRRPRRGGTARGAGATDPARRAESRAFLERSLADTDAEYLAGDLSDHDYLTLRRRDLARLSALDEPATTAGAVAVAQGARPAASPPSETADEVDGGAPTTNPAAAPRRGRRSWWFLAGAVVAFGAALAVAVVQLSSDRLPGQTPSGNVPLSPSQQVEATLAQAAADEDGGQVNQAASLYQQVLAAHPDNEVALAQLGWIEFEAGHPTTDQSLLADARAKLERAVRLAPSDDAAHLYLGTLLLEEDGSAAAAVDQFRSFLAEHPVKALVARAAPVIRQAFVAAGQPVPPEVAAGS